MKKNYFISLIVFIVLPFSQAFAKEGVAKEELQDMSNPIAVYTQGGLGVTDKGFYLKVGRSYTPTAPEKMGMNIFEIKGFGGKLLGIRDSDDPLFSNVDDSIDSIRLRNLEVNKKGIGTHIDINYNADADQLDASYSFIATAPKLGQLQFYPLAGVGVTVADDYGGEDDGYEIPGTFAVVGTYSTLHVTDIFWFSYNPMFMQTLMGSDLYKDHNYAGEDNILAHEFAISYKLTPRAMIRYNLNWNKHVDVEDGDHRIEFNYQL